MKVRSRGVRQHPGWRRRPGTPVSDRHAQRSALRTSPPHPERTLPPSAPRPTAAATPTARNAGLRPARAALRAAHVPTPPGKHGPTSAQRSTAAATPTARNAGLRPARAALRAAHLPTPPRKHGSPLGATLTRGGDTNGPERRSPTGTRSAPRCAPPHPTRKARSHLGTTLNRGSDIHGPERRSPTGTRSAPRCARPHPTRKARFPPRRNAQPQRRHPRPGTPASAGTAARRRFVANPSGRTRSRAIPAIEVVPPPACGGLCRLKPAFQTVPATLGLSIPARTFTPGGVVQEDRS